MTSLSPDLAAAPARQAAALDAIVLGGGIVGTSIALHLALRGRSVALVDRRGVGEETSHGNSGLVERSALSPAAFPQGLGAFLRVVLDRYPGAHYHWDALPGLARWLLAYRAASRPERLAETARTMHPLVSLTVDEHRALARAAGAERLFREGGWIKLYRTEHGLDGEREEIAFAAEFGFRARELTVPETLELEPGLNPVFRGAVVWDDPHSVSDPGGVVKAYAAHLEAVGGRVVTGDARTLQEVPGGWQVRTESGPLAAREAVVALGPWSMDVLRPLGYRMPLAVKRGYHMHYGPGASGNAGLSRPVLDEEHGYVLTPMARGVRLTTGAEFARRDAPPTPVQVDRAERVARTLFPLGERVDPEPWMGARPIFPDSRPAIGPAPRHRGLWMAFGHQHLGFTLGPATGRLLAEMMTGQGTIVDPAPYSPARF